MAEVRHVVRHPADPESGYRLWSNAWIEAFGDAVPVSWSPDFAQYDRCQHLWVYDWIEPRLLVLTDDGARHAINDAPGGGPPLGPNNWKVWRWMAMDPAGTGRGYVFAIYGAVQKIGTGTPDLAPGFPSFGSDQLRDVQCDYDTGRWVALAKDGGCWASGGIAAPSWVANRGLDFFRSIAVRSWASTPIPFYLGTHDGRTEWANGAEPAYRGAQLAGRGDVVRDLSIISDGTSGDPLTVAFTLASGAEWRYTVSAPPTVTMVEPTGTVDDTTRPAGRWDYSDPDGDDQVRAEVAWFTEAQATIGGFDPATSPALERQTIVERNVFTATPTVELDSGDYRLYVRAQDSAGQWSPWDHGAFEVDVTPPATPTVAATPDGEFAVTVDVSGGEVAVEVEFSDDDGTTWQPLTAAPVPVDGGAAAVVDHDAPFTTTRLYRARSVDGALRSAWSEPAGATVGEQRRWVLSRPGEPHHLVVGVPVGHEWVNPVPAGVHTPGDVYDAVVVRTMRRSPRSTLTFRFRSAEQRAALDAMWPGTRTVLLRSPAGHHWYCDVAGDITTHLDGVASGQQWGRIDVPVAVTGRPPL